MTNNPSEKKSKTSRKRKTQPIIQTNKIKNYFSKNSQRQSKATVNICTVQNLEVMVDPCQVAAVSNDEDQISVYTCAQSGITDNKYLSD